VEIAADAVHAARQRYAIVLGSRHGLCWNPKRAFGVFEEDKIAEVP
jgi:hypothetical protein